MFLSMLMAAQDAGTAREAAEYAVRQALSTPGLATFSEGDSITIGGGPARRAHRHPGPVADLRAGPAAIVAAALLLGGCSTYVGTSRPAAATDLAEPGWIVARNVPVIAQREERDCGIAALAMVLAHWKAVAGIDDVRAGCPPVAERGVEVSALKAFAEKQGLEAYLFNGDFKVFENELGRGRPVLVGLGKRTLGGAVSHFEVVVAYHPGRGIVMTHDPALGARVNDEAGFLEEWNLARCLTLVIFRPAND